MKSFISRLTLIFTLVCSITCFSPISASAGSLDDLSSGDVSNDTYTGLTEDSALTDYLRGYTPITDENMQKASTLSSPIVSALGTASGFIIMCVSGGIFFITALDLVYIGIPPLRSFLNPSMQSGGASPMGGMGMGMGGYGMGGSPQGGQGQSAKRRWVSDEAVACVNMAQSGGQQGGMGMGMGMNSMMGGMQQQQSQPTKSVIFEYLKKRSFFIIIFTVATVLLMSSLFTDCGLNLAELLDKIIQRLNGTVSSVQI